jgi:putative ABC transport system permease protein
MEDFDKEQAIKEWRQQLKKQQGLEPGMIEELEHNLRDRIDEFVIKGYSQQEAFGKAAQKSLGNGDGEAVADEFFKARTPFYKNKPPWKGEAKWFGLLPNFLKVALRSFNRKKIYTGINFLGLTIGLLTACFVGLYINYELSWDEFHSESENIYRIGQNFRSQEYSLSSFDGFYGASREVQRNQIQGFENTRGVRDVAHFWIFGGPSYLNINDRQYTQDGLLTTNTPDAFFKLFDWEFRYGSAENFASNTGRAVVTESAALKISGSNTGALSKLVGQTMIIDSTNYEIAGIIQDIPSNSHYEFEVALHDPKIEYWGGRTYALLDEEADAQEVKQRFDKNVANINPRLASEDDLFKGFAIHNLEDIHLQANALYEIKPPGSILYIYVFGIIGLIILLITFTNYTNLSVAMYSGRNREIGIRKVLGAGRSQVAGQFLIESLLLSVLCVPVVLGLIHFLLPYFNNFMGVDIANLFLDSPLYFGLLVIVATLIGGIAGAYPAFVMSGKKIRNLFSKQLTKPTVRGFTLRKGLITFQFVLLIGLGSATYLINSQLEYISSKDIGYAKDGIVYVLMEDNEKYAEFKDRLASVSGINSVGSGTPLARSTFNQVTYQIDGNEKVFDDGYSIYMNPGALQAYGIETSVDQYFENPGNTPDTLHLINESGAEKFARVMGVTKEELIGMTFRTEPSYTQDDGTVGFPRQIDGFFEDINMFSLREEIDPYFMEVRPDVTTSWAIVNYNTVNIGQALDDIESTYAELGQSFPLITRFQDQRLANLYQQDRRMGTLTIYLSLLAFLVAVLGLVGLAAYLTTLREKEIGVRKVLGASIGKILYQMNKEYVYLVGMSLLIAAPIAYYAIQQWLSNFAYRISINGGVFLVVGLATLIIAFAAVSSQTLRAATNNPVQSLRNEQ